jgi:hypothetical protein
MLLADVETFQALCHMGNFVFSFRMLHCQFSYECVAGSMCKPDSANWLTFATKMSCIDDLDDSDKLF